MTEACGRCGAELVGQHARGSTGGVHIPVRCRRLSAFAERGRFAC